MCRGWTIFLRTTSYYSHLSSCWIISIFTVLPATFVCPVTLCTNERAVSGYWYLARSYVSLQLYQHLSYTVNMLVPVRYSFKPYHERRQHRFIRLIWALLIALGFCSDSIRQATWYSGLGLVYLIWSLKIPRNSIGPGRTVRWVYSVSPRSCCITEQLVHLPFRPVQHDGMLSIEM
jgi:hypothetical protein